MVGLDVFLSERVVLFTELKPESLVALGQGGFGEEIPDIGTVGLVGDLFDTFRKKSPDGDER